MIILLNSNLCYYNWRLSAKEAKDDYKSFKDDKIKELLANNQQWASENKYNKALLFDKLKLQWPEVLWIGKA